MKTIAISYSCLIVFRILPLVALREGLEIPMEVNIITEALVHVVENIGYETSSSFHVSYSSISNESSHQQASIINDFLLRTKENLLVSVDDIRYFDRRRSELRKFTLLLIDSRQGFERITPLLQSGCYDSNGKHLILISQDLEERDRIILIQRIFEEFFHYYIVNVELVVRDRTTGLIDFYTYYPVNPRYCFKVVPVLHGTLNLSQSIKDLSLFPRKFENFFGCPLTLVTFPFPPHVFLNTSKNNTVEGTGIDIKVLNGVAEKLNFSVVIIDAKARGVLYPNGSLTGAIKILYDDQANITLGGYSSAAKAMLLFTPSIAYLHTAMVFAIPPEKEYSPLERLLLPFDLDVWFAIGLPLGLTFVTSVLLGIWNQTYRDVVFGNTVRYPVFEMIVVYLGGGVARFPNGAIARNIILQWLIVSLVLSSCYKAVLFGMLKDGFLKKFPSTVEGMLDDGFLIDVPLPLIQNLRDGPLGARNSFVLLQYSLHTHYASLQTGRTKRMVLDTNIQLQHFNSIYYESGILKSLPQRLFIFPLFFYYRKRSYLVEPINDVLKQFIESGLVTFWRDSVLNVSHLEKTQTSNAMNPLQVKNFQGCFALCGVLIACSVFVFFLELVSLRIERVKRILLCRV